MRSRQSLRKLLPPASAIFLMLLICLAMAFNGCASRLEAGPVTSGLPLPEDGGRCDEAADPDAGGVDQRLRKAVSQWIGTPHRMGGDSPQGIDCSGFVQRIYRELFDVKLPRSTALQVRFGAAVNRNALSAGDLVFFHPPHKIRHVGIYLNNGEFAHASTSRGVTISRLDAPYWRNAYWTARRVLPDPAL